MADGAREQSPSLMKSLSQLALVAGQAGETSNALFEVLEDWEAQLKPYEHELSDMEP